VATFAGVYMITWSGSSSDSPDRESEIEASSRPGSGDHVVTGNFSRETRRSRERSTLGKRSSTGLLGFSPAQVLQIKYYLFATQLKVACSAC
jgi:hypothetical protein